MQTSLLSTYLIPGVLDIPEQVQSVILEYPDPRGPWGAGGMAEMPFLPLTPDLDTAAAAETITTVLFDDLQFEREFYVIPRDVVRTVPAPRTVDTAEYDRWRRSAHGGEYLR